MQSEKQWEAEYDVRTLTEAEAIKSDKSRLSRAKRAGTRMLREKKQEVSRIQKIAKKPAVKTKRTTSRRKK